MRIMIPFRLLLLFLLAVAGATSLSAQQPTVRSVVGRVLDATSREPLVGATVRLYSVGDSAQAVPTKFGDAVDIEGWFEISLPSDGVYVVEAISIGYNTKRVPVSGTDTLLVQLSADRTLEPQVIVKGVRRSRSVEDACCRVESIREEVQQHAPFSPSAVDVLRRYSSCTSTRTSCALDNSQSVRLRGLEPTYIGVLVDGVPAISGFGTFYGLGMIPSHALQTISIAEGASSARYGNNAVSGIVDLQIRQPTDFPELIVTGNLTGDGFAVPEERDFNVSYTGMAGDVGLAAFGSVNSHNRLDGAIPGRYQRFSGLLKGNYMLDDATELTITGLGGRELRDGRLHGSEEALERVEQTRGDLTTKLAHSFSDETELTATAFVSSTGIDADYGAVKLDGVQRILYGSLGYLTEIGDHGVSLGAEVRDDRLSLERGPSIEYATTVGSLYLQDELPVSSEVTLLGSVRVDHHLDAGMIVSPRGSLKYEPAAGLTMRLMAGEGFKGQALFDEQQHRALHGGFEWRQNRNMTFERSMTLNYDISYDFTFGSAVGLSTNFNAYYTTIDGKVVLDEDSLAAGTLFMVNSDRPTRLTGLELQLRPTIGEHLSGSLALALISYAMQNTSGTYERIPLAPALNLDASLMYRDEETGITAEAWGSLIGSQRLPANPSGMTESDAYVMLNTRLEKQLGAFAVYIGVNNLLDVTQAETMPLSFSNAEHYDASIVWGPLEGRETFVGIRFKYGGAE